MVGKIVSLTLAVSTNRPLVELPPERSTALTYGVRAFGLAAWVCCQQEIIACNGNHLQGRFWGLGGPALAFFSFPAKVEA